MPLLHSNADNAETNVSHTEATASKLPKHALLIIDGSILSDESPVTTSALISHAKYIKMSKLTLRGDSTGAYLPKGSSYQKKQTNILSSKHSIKNKARIQRR